MMKLKQVAIHVKKNLRDLGLSATWQDCRFLTLSPPQTNSSKIQPPSTLKPNQIITQPPRK